MPKAASALPESQVTPEPGLEKRTRRQFTPDYKLRIIAEADACKHGELGAMLRREKLYSNQLSAWRQEYGERGVDGLSKSTPGPATSVFVNEVECAAALRIGRQELAVMYEKLLK